MESVSPAPSSLASVDKSVLCVAVFPFTLSCFPVCGTQSCQCVYVKTTNSRGEGQLCAHCQACISLPLCDSLFTLIYTSMAVKFVWLHLYEFQDPCVH